MRDVDNKHKAVWNWLYQNEDVKRLYFNFSDVQTGNTTIATSTGNADLKKYLDGTALKAYDFSLIQYQTLNTVDVNSDENADTMFDTERLMAWIEEQERIKNYPVFPGCFVTKVENLQNMPSVAGMDDARAKYLFSCRITYLEKAKQ